MSSRRESTESANEEAIRRYSIVTKLVHYTSKFLLNDDERRPSIQTSTRYQPPSRNERRRSTLVTTNRFV
jgi:hypothetical protein